MERPRIILSLGVLMCLSMMSNAQTEIIRKGLIRAQATFSPSYMFSAKQSYFYLHGNLEGFLSSKVSIAGEGYYFLGNDNSEKGPIHFSHNLFFGANYHFVKNNNDFYVGFQPGMAFTQLNLNRPQFEVAPVGYNPVASCVVGYNFFVGRFVHFFLQSRLVIGEHNVELPRGISDVRFSAGLGFNVNALRN